MRIRSVPVLEVLQNRNFQFLWAARWIHEISRRMELIVLGYLILELTGSAFQVGLISVFLNGPRPPLSLVAGMLADRLDRWRILVGMHTVYLLIAARHDPITPLEIQQLMTDTMPNATLEAFDGVGHNMKVEIPDILARRTLDFIDTIDSP